MLKCAAYKRHVGSLATKVDKRNNTKSSIMHLSHEGESGIINLFMSNASSEFCSYLLNVYTNIICVSIT